jgi:uroporphyrinogen decarboxylase
MAQGTAVETMTGEERMLGACRREAVDCTPVWFMRQAGRCIAEYRELREKYDILTMTRTPDLCVQVTLMPVELMGVDAAVMYADIMLPLYGMGVPFSIDPGIGPVIHEPVRDEAAVRALRIAEPEEGTPELFQSIGMVRQELAGRAAVVGFAGAPYTLASYMIEGKASKDRARAKTLMYSRPGLWAELMETLTEVTVRYLKAQVDAGAQVLQLFDSWIGDLGPSAYEAHVLPYSRRIFDAVRETGVPTIHFGTGVGGMLEHFASAGSDLVCVDWRISLADAWRRIGEDKGIQGNLDPTVVLAPWETIEAEASRVLSEAEGRPGHVFNLGHGVLPDTDPAQLTRLVEFVHAATSRKEAGE